jgi:hypothetical protein
MAKSKPAQLWLVNVISFVLFSLLGGTGLINWLLLPKGYQARGPFLISLRHFFVWVHQWTALLFILVVALHLSLHWKYIKSNIERYHKRN